MAETKDQAPKVDPAARNPAVGEALEKVWDVLRTRAKPKIEEAARQGRHRLEVAQSKKDLDRLYQKLGREAVRLVEAGEVDHPGLVAGVERIHQQQEALRKLEEG